MDIEKWANQDLWSEDDLSCLCCGIEPGASREMHIQEINEATEKIRRGVLSGELKLICPLDASQGDRLYGHDRFFRVSNAARWATRMFSSFPIVSKSTESDAINEIDPSDLPFELDAANMAFRAVSNGYGDQAATPRNRLVKYLESHYSHFTKEQVLRIATVANPDKSPGRKKSYQEYPRY